MIHVHSIKKYWIIIFVFLFLNVPTIALANIQAKVTLPTFPITLNGTTIDNTNLKYPLIVYQDITYFPMTYHGSRFLNVKANWYDSTNVLFVGKAEDRAQTLQLEKTASKNKASYTAVIPTYKIAVNTVQPAAFLDNSKEPYPVLNFRGVTYFPLTWRFAVDAFGWEYQFDQKKGLTINGTNMFCPVLDDREIGYTSPSATGTDYFCHDNYYVGYPRNTFQNNFQLIVCKRGEREKVYSLEDQLLKDDYYFNEQYDKKGTPVNPVSKIAPTIEGNVFSIYCRKLSTEENVLIQINLDTGIIISQDVIPK